MDKNALFKVGYGLYVVTACENGFDNGCILNTFTQITDTPIKVAAIVNKLNKTCSMIKNTGKFNVSVLSEEADFSLFKRFGFKSGAEFNKFDGFCGAKRAENGILYITEATNSYICCDVESTVDFGTHLMFVSSVSDASVILDVPSVTYDFYHKNIKPKPEPNKKIGFRCKICGYVYEGETLPEDFICPLCKHGAEDFEKISG